MIVCAFMLFVYRGLFTESRENSPQWVVTLIIGMFGPYCSLRFTSRTTGFVSQIANRSFNFVVRDAEPDLEPSVIWASDDENEYFGALDLIYPFNIPDLPRTMTRVWIRASWRPAHASIVFPLDGAWIHIAVRPPRGTSAWQYEYGDGSFSFTAPHPSRLPMSLRILDQCPTVVFIEDLRAKRREGGDDNDPTARSSNEVPDEEPSCSEENPVNDSLSRRSSGMPDPEPSRNPTPSDSRAGEFSSNVVQNDGEDLSDFAPRPEPEVEQPCESLTEGPNPSVSYLRSLFENHGNPAAPTSTIHSTNQELFTIEVATGEEEIESPPNDSPVDYYGIRPISAYAFYPRRDSSSDGSLRNAEIYERATASRNNPH